MKMKFLVNMGAALAMGVASLAVSAAPAQARDHYRGYDRGDYYRGGYDRGYRGYDRGYRGDYYRGGYDRGYRGDRYRGYRGGYRCRDNGTGGTIIGAIAGGLLGNEIGKGSGRYGRRGDGTTGAIVGAGVGALAGRAIDRNC
ncbi:glycine zipper 2TM domain-containing protein [Sphingobium sp. YR768]|uniref:glycine zipper 2TM domain-containing protein n=1 Tax=Sphingobium sp. YR768 TaxID=1884365 RepID=UPI0008D4D431|nr:glycine zipper 2TM domain-containing protein [Sphingobium sp. YR768]SEQ91697.1 Glycine zipper 2TM domain-containing protein [Sphingobium sp. YR768]